MAAAESRPSKTRPTSFAEARDRLGRLERFNIWFVRKSFDHAWLSGVLSWFQRTIGQGWVYYCTRNLLYVRGLERFPRDIKGPLIVVCNHRSFFDMFVAMMVLYHGKLYTKRMVYPVRANFFYDHVLGLFVNGLMSFFSMYPPIFRDRKRLLLNHVAMSELSNDLIKKGFGAGIHPEGTRNLEDPYELLPGQNGVGRLIEMSGATVVPVFVNGLGNDLPKQVGGNFNGKGDCITAVYGEPIDFSDLEAEDGAKMHRAMTERCMERIKALAEEERAWRPEVEAGRAQKETVAAVLQNV